MINLLLAVLAGIVGFGLGWAMGSPLYGIAPGLGLFLLAWFLLGRRTGRQLEKVLQGVQSDLQAGRIKAARRRLEAARKLGRWQVFLTQQVDGQLGALAFLEGREDEARRLLSRTWARNHQALHMLAVLDLRRKRHADALAHLERARRWGRKDPLTWALTARVHLEAGDPDAALAAVAEGLEALPDNAALKKLQAAIANRRTRKFRWGQVFGEAWYVYFPREVPRQRLQGLQPGVRGKTWPQPRR